MNESKIITNLDFKDEFRDLSKIEYQNIKAKSELGTIPVDYLRKNLFNATGTALAVPSNYKKVLFENDKYKVSVDRYLHQRHKDIITVLFADNLGVSQPAKDGSYYIYTNLTHIARALGYTNPNSSIQRVKSLLNDLRGTDLKIFDKEKKLEHGHHLLGEYTLDIEKGFYLVQIPARTAKYHILNFGVEIPKEMNRDILKIPIKFAKLKAIITYILSSKPLRNGITLEVLMSKLEIESTPKSRSLFKKEILDNIETLEKFNIEFDKTTKKLYLKHTLKFEREVTHEEIIDSYAKEGQLGDLKTKTAKNNEKEFEEVIVLDLNYLKMKYVNKYIRIQEKNYLIKDFLFKKNSDSGENESILIRAEINNVEINISSNTMNFEEMLKKLIGYNQSYLDFKNDISTVSF